MKVGENSVTDLRLMLRKVEQVRGECEELLLYYVGESNYFFCLAGRMPVRFAG